MLKKLLSKKNRALFAELVRTDFKLRYQGSILGYTWSVLKPLLMFSILYLVFGVIFNAGKGIPNFPVYLLLGIVMWNFFSEITQQCLISIVQRGDLIRKIRIPRWLILVSASFSAVINLFFNMFIVLIFALITKIDLLSTSILLPIYILEVYIFGLGLAMLLAALYVKYRDTTHIWDVVLQAGFYATPVLYPLSLISNTTIQQVLMSNPMAHAIQEARHAFVTNQTVTGSDVFVSNLSLFIPLFIIGISFWLGLYIFKKDSKYFAENL